MRRFIVYSGTAHTYPVIKNLKAAGRIDVLLHSIISSLFASNTFREDVELHLILMGPPTSPRHIIIKYDEKSTISKKDMKTLIEIALRRYKEGETKQVHPGVFVDNKSIVKVVEELKKDSENIYVLDFVGDRIKSLTPDKLVDATFVLGDHDGFSRPVKKFLKKNTTRLSLGPQIYFTSQSITIINYELDNLE
ncbi:MAG: hypothetical protein PF569_04115 [Candidatus Woesearchaeota archaeon]|jgi:tRNA (pseudouridine54-N1)-methyltransferase|nr:hypothetical protein [Candidatus Woesearchaeota archaeon]